MDPTRFAFGLMTRSKAITYDNLALRAPEFVSEVDRVVARDVRALGFPAETAKPLAPMFQQFRRDAPASTRTRTRPPGSASSISCMRNRRRSSACSSGMPAARVRPS
jgi:hypothetical protein